MTGARIRKYRTKSGAQRYANKLTERFPLYEFQIVQHPWDFGWAIAAFHPNMGLAYVETTL